MSYKLSQIRNWRSCGVGSPDGFEMEALLEAMLETMDYYGVEATAKMGCAEPDAEAIAGLIAAYDLDITPEEAEAAFVASCRRRVAREISEDRPG